MNWVKKTTSILVACLLVSSYCIGQNSLRKATKQLELQEFDAAISALQSILESDPDSQDALVTLGNAYRLTNQLENSKEAFQKAITNSEMPIKAYRTYGDVLMGLKDYEGALQQYSVYGTEYLEESQLLVAKCSYAIEHQKELSKFSVNEEYVNTSKRDFSPSFFEDDVIYLSNRRDLSQNQNNPYNPNVDIEMLKSAKDSKGLLKLPKRIKSLTGNEFNFISLAYNPVLNLVAVTKAPQFANVHLTIEDKCTLYIGMFDKHGAIKKLKPYEFNQTNVSTGFASFSEDGMTMYFASDRAGGEGGFDIYESQLIGGEWSAPINLGKEINTTGNEITPYPAGTALLFASDTHPGFGGYDIFKTEKDRDHYSIPENLGTDLNSSFDDFGMVYNVVQNLGYITSTRPAGKGLEDIYRVKSLVPFTEMKVMAQAEATKKKPSNLDYEILKGMTFDLVDGLPLSQVEIFASTDDESTIVSAKSNEQGKFSIPLVAGKYYTLKFESKGFLNSSRTVMMEKSRDMPLMKIDMKSRRLVQNKKDQPVAKPVVLGKTFPSTTKSEIVSKPIEPEIVNIEDQPSGKLKSEKPENKQTTVAEPSPLKLKYTAPTNSKAYAIQLAAVSKNAAVTRFSNVKDLGSLYTLFDSRVYKVRCGLYSTREEAQAVLERVKIRGYETAFIVEEKASDNMELVMMDFGTTLPKKPTERIRTESVQRTIPSVREETLISPFKVRLATYSDTKWFDASKVEGEEYGYVEIVLNEKGQSIYLLAGFETFDRAELAMSKARKQGFIDAIVVKDENGMLVKMD